MSKHAVSAPETGKRVRQHHPSIAQVIARSRSLLDLAEIGARGPDPEVAQDRLATLRRELATFLLACQHRR